MNFLSRNRIETRENPVQIVRTAAGSPFPQPLAQFLGALRARKQSFEQGAQIKASPPNDNRKMMASSDFRQHLPGLTRVLSRSDFLRRMDVVQEVVRDLGSFCRRWFRR